MRRFLTKLTLATGLIATPVFGQSSASVSVHTPQPTRSWMYATNDPKMEKGTFLGAATSGVSAELREHLALQKGFGLIVDSLDKDSPAEKAGLQRYDILQKLDDQRLVNALQLQVLIRSYKPNDKITLTLLRKGQPMTVNVTLIESNVPELSDAQLEGQPLDPTWGWGPTVLKVDGLNLNSTGTSTTRFPGSDPFSPGAGGGAKFVFKTQDQTLELTQNGDSKNLVVKDKDDKIIFQGPIDTEEQRSKLPPGVEAKLKQMQIKFTAINGSGTGGGGGSTQNAEPPSSLPGK
ncbi:MAG TPA: PDZ domain-containing protein [Tepidisphaeraceae bacterium]|nr:PDZ domain-containing protein [Tepidisphaeraceae bacterium]